MGDLPRGAQDGLGPRSCSFGASGSLKDDTCDPVGIIRRLALRKIARGRVRSTVPEKAPLSTSGGAPAGGVAPVDDARSQSNQLVAHLT